MNRKHLMCLSAFLAFSWTLMTSRAGGDGFRPLFNGKDLTGWKTVTKDNKGNPAEMVTVKDGEIQVSGFPYGFFYSEQSFKNYVLRYSWRYPKEQPEKTTMNSGLLMHIQPPVEQVWPKSIEPQGRYKDHGKLFLPGFPKGSTLEQTFDEAKQQKAIKPAEEWNTTEVTAKPDGTVEVKLNGQPINSAKTPLTSGPVGFQSEGARIHFKDIMLKELR